MNEIMETKSSRRGFLGAVATVAAFFGLGRRADAIEATRVPEKIHEQRCMDGCGAVIGRVGLPEDAPPEQIAKALTGSRCNPCGDALAKRQAVEYHAEYAAVMAKKPTPEQARLIKSSQLWADLHWGRRAAYDEIINDAVREMLS